MADVGALDSLGARSGQDGGGEPARVRVAHASPEAPNVDVFLDDNKVLADVPFGAISDYISVAAGTYTAAITPAGEPDTVAFDGEISVEAETA